MFQQGSCCHTGILFNIQVYTAWLLISNNFQSGNRNDRNRGLGNRNRDNSRGERTKERTRPSRFSDAKETVSTNRRDTSKRERDRRESGIITAFHSSTNFPYMPFWSGFNRFTPVTSMVLNILAIPFNAVLLLTQMNCKICCII